jgi:Insertion element 4 transposase N-terminal/Transposase DDE domain
VKDSETSGKSGQPTTVFPIPEVSLRAQSATVTITHAVTVAAGVFAPGHLGELTQYLPFELVDDVLEQTGTVQRRLRALPSRVGVYFVVALGLFPDLGYARVWGKLTAGLAGLDLPRPSEKALRDLRRRLGPAPLKALFEVVAGPLAWPRTPGAVFGSLRTVAFDGCNSLKIADTPRNRAWAGKSRGSRGEAAYPALRLMTLAETGTRALLGAVAGTGADRDEATLARHLLHLLQAGMLVLADRAFDSGPFLAAVAATGADLLIRVKATRTPLVEAHLPDGSFLSRIGGVSVRIIAAHIHTAGADGSHAGGHCRLVTTLTDHRRYPAHALVALYHERWETEIAFLALRHTLLEGRVLRSGDPPGVQQELWALLTIYQLLRMAMVTAAETRPGTDPDRVSFTTATQAAIAELTTARGIITPPGPPDLPGAIGRAVLATLLPPRRARYSSRTIRCPISRYATRTGTRPTTTTPTTTTITITPPPPIAPIPEPRPGTRCQHLTALITASPNHTWTSRELATLTSARPNIISSQLAHWAKTGYLTRTGTGTYKLNTPPNPASSTTAPDP